MILTLMFAVNAYQDLTSAAFIKRIFAHPSWLGIPNSKALLMMEWPTIAARLSLRQSSRPFYYPSGPITTLDISNIIMRRDNMMIMLANSGSLEAYAPSWIPRRLLYSEPVIMALRLIIINRIVDDARPLGRNFHSLVIRMKMKIKVLGLILLILTPAVFVLSVAYLLMRDAHSLKSSTPGTSRTSSVINNAKSTVSSYGASESEGGNDTSSSYVWSKEAKIKLRQYSELSHFFDSRLGLAARHLDSLLELKWHSALVRAVVRVSLFALGSYLALLLIVGVVDDKALFDVSFMGKQLVFHMAVAGALVAFLASIPVGSAHRIASNQMNSASIFGHTMSLAQYIHKFPSWVLGGIWLGEGLSFKQKKLLKLKQKAASTPAVQSSMLLMDHLEEPLWQRSIPRQGSMDAASTFLVEQPLVRLIISDLKSGQVTNACKRIMHRVSWNLSPTTRSPLMTAAEGNFIGASGGEGIGAPLIAAETFDREVTLRTDMETWEEETANSECCVPEYETHDDNDLYENDPYCLRSPVPISDFTNRNKNQASKKAGRLAAASESVLGAGLDWILIDPMSTLGSNLFSDQIDELDGEGTAEEDEYDRFENSPPLLHATGGDTRRVSVSQQHAAEARLSGSAGVAAARLMDAHLGHLKDIQQSLATSRGSHLIWEILSILSAPLILMFVLPRTMHALLGVALTGSIVHPQFGVLAAAGLLDPKISGGVSWGGQSTEAIEWRNKEQDAMSEEHGHEGGDLEEEVESGVNKFAHFKKSKTRASAGSRQETPRSSSNSKADGDNSIHLPYASLAHNMNGLSLPPSNELPALTSEGFRVLSSAITFALNHRIPANPLSMAVASQKYMSSSNANLQQADSSAFNSSLKRRTVVLPPANPPPSHAFPINHPGASRTSDGPSVWGSFLPAVPDLPSQDVRTPENLRTHAPNDMSPTTVETLSPGTSIPVWGYPIEVLCLLARLTRFQYLMQSRSQEMRVLLEMLPETVCAARTLQDMTSPPLGTDLVSFANEMAVKVGMKVAGLADPSIPAFGYRNDLVGYSSSTTPVGKKDNSVVVGGVQLMKSAVLDGHFNRTSAEDHHQHSKKHRDQNKNGTDFSKDARATILAGPGITGHSQTAQLEAEITNLIFHQCASTSNCQCEFIASMSHCVDVQWGGSSRSWAVALEPVGPSTVATMMFWLGRWHTVAREVLGRYVAKQHAEEVDTADELKTNE